MTTKMWSNLNLGQIYLKAILFNKEHTHHFILLYLYFSTGLSNRDYRWKKCIYKKNNWTRLNSDDWSIQNKCDYLVFHTRILLEMQYCSSRSKFQWPLKCWISCTDKVYNWSFKMFGLQLYTVSLHIEDQFLLSLCRHKKVPPTLLKQVTKT